MMNYTIFKTDIGLCKLGWMDSHIQSVKIDVKGKVSNEIPSWLKPTVAKVQKHLSGKLQNFSDCPLDLSAVPLFHRSVYRVLCKVPAGKTVSYAELALRAGSPRAARAVGQAMAKNPLPILIPCHRVLTANGRIGNYSAGKGSVTKAKLLALESCTTLMKK
ncbi:MAG: cysteine methyltransferase [Deltaproteobacteria bacterium CG11_big_fil_rev_8_21_14_0_20_47_16]|nr:MAG: cysteine methyltransferase [Deltaproteobacteria bacterium CG11_big_fil_rev_8_21_14_0_20_47_16]